MIQNPADFFRRIELASVGVHVENDCARLVRSPRFSPRDEETSERRRNFDPREGMTTTSPLAQRYRCAKSAPNDGHAARMAVKSEVRGSSWHFIWSVCSAALICQRFAVPHEQNPPLGTIPTHTIEQIAAANDIVEVIGSYFPLKRAGANFQGALPVSSGEDAVVSRRARRGNRFIALAVGRRKRFPVRDGLRARRFSDGGAQGWRRGAGIPVIEERSFSRDRGSPA